MKNFTRQRILLFLADAALGFLFKTLNIPIQYMLDGIVVNLSNQFFGVLSATGSIVIVSLIASLMTFRMTQVNLISCFTGCALGGMSLITLMAEEDSRANINFVVVAQILRFTCVVVSVPFLAMHMLYENVSAVALEHVDGLNWLVLSPLVWLERFLGKKLHLPTKQLLGPILVAAIFSTLVQPFESAPKLLMAIVQLNICLYIGTKLEKDLLLILRSTLPNLIFGNAAMIATSLGISCFDCYS